MHHNASTHETKLEITARRVCVCVLYKSMFQVLENGKNPMYRSGQMFVEIKNLHVVVKLLVK